MLFCKFSDSQYMNGIVSLSSHKLTNAEISVLSKGLGFCPTPGAPDIGNIIWMLLKEEPDYNSFSLDPTGTNTKRGVPLNISPSILNHPSIQ